MNAEVLKTAGIDYDRGVKRFLGRAQLYEKSLSRFARDTSFARIQAAFRAGDTERMFAAAHEFKGMCGNIALTSLYELSSTLAELLRGGAYPRAAVAAAYEKLETEYGKVHQAVLTAMEGAI